MDIEPILKSKTFYVIIFVHWIALFLLYSFHHVSKENTLKDLNVKQKEIESVNPTVWLDGYEAGYRDSILHTYWKINKYTVADDNETAILYKEEQQFSSTEKFKEEKK